MEDILAIILIFGGGTVIGLAFSPVGRALTDRLRGIGSHSDGTDPAVYDELERLRSDLTELQERVDFNERLLAGGRQGDRASGAS